MLLRVVHALAESDCEQVGSDLLAQPVNALSSLVFSLIGIVVLTSIGRAQESDRLNRVVFGTLLITTGIGSFLFHGPQGTASHFLHDITFLATVIAVALMNLAGLKGWDNRRTLGVLSGIVLSIAAVLLAVPSSTNILAAAALVLLVATDVMVQRSGSLNRRWWIVAVVSLALAFLFFVTGRTGGPICDSQSLFQGHALWHVLSATALWAYFEATTPTRRRG